ncbi:MAG: beta-lactamase family protein [Lachnospiraceae bacterium]|nr:beta-lactamase family protein [Lachnospiraceae bacterium]
MNFDAFVNDIRTNGWNVFGAEVYEDGKLTCSYGDTNDNVHEIYSATKAVLSVTVDIAKEDVDFDIDKPVTYYLPKGRLDALPEEQRRTFDRLSVRRFLTMSVGDLPFRAEGNSFLDFALGVRITDPDAHVFNYSNISAYLVGVALAEALGTDLGKYIEEKLFVPLRIDKFEYDRCPEGYFYGASGMKLTVNELSRVGMLLYNKGIFEGKRILSEKYVEEATSIQQMNREGGYGYFLWKYRDGFSINGKWKQKCYILPERKLIVTYLSHIEDDSHDLLDSMEKNILGVTG